MSFYATAKHQEETRKLLDYRLSIGVTAVGGSFSNKALVKRAREQGFVLSVMTTFSMLLLIKCYFPFCVIKVCMVEPIIVVFRACIGPHVLTHKTGHLG